MSILQVFRAICVFCWLIFFTHIYVHCLVVNEVVARDHSHILGDEAELCRYHPLLSGHGYKHPAKITVKKENLENIQVYTAFILYTTL